MSQPDERTLTHLLDVVEDAAQAGHLSVQDMINEFGDRSITPFILLISVFLILPLSGIPTVPTFSAIIIVSLVAQALFGRRHVWLPGFVLRRKVSADRLVKAIGWLRRPCRFLDRHSHVRLAFLIRGPMRMLSLLICMIVPLGWPFLELLPLVTSVGAALIALISFGLFTRDGLYVLLGYLQGACLIGLLIWLWP